MDEANRWTSAATQRIVRRKTRKRDWVIPPDGTPARLAAVDPLYIDVGTSVRRLRPLTLRFPPQDNFCGPQAVPGRFRLRYIVDISGAQSAEVSGHGPAGDRNLIPANPSERWYDTALDLSKTSGVYYIVQPSGDYTAPITPNRFIKVTETQEGDFISALRRLGLAETNCGSSPVGLSVTAESRRQAVLRGALRHNASHWSQQDRIGSAHPTS